MVAMLLIFLIFNKRLFASLEIGEPFYSQFRTQRIRGHLQVLGIVQDQPGSDVFWHHMNLVNLMAKIGGNTHSHDVVRSLAVDNEGTIYVGGNGEFGYLASDSQGQAGLPSP